ncbi:hypothetical protein V8E53_005624 [Lactarius tabidus]
MCYLSHTILTDRGFRGQYHGLQVSSGKSCSLPTPRSWKSRLQQAQVPRPVAAPSPPFLQQRSRRLLLNARLSAQRQCGHDPAILEGRCEWYLYWRLDQVPSRGRKDIGETLEQCVLREAYKDVHQKSTVTGIPNECHTSRAVRGYRGLPVAPLVADPLDRAAPRRPGLASRSNVTVATITLTTLTAIDVVRRLIQVDIRPAAGFQASLNPNIGASTTLARGPIFNLGRLGHSGDKSVLTRWSQPLHRLFKATPPNPIHLNAEASCQYRDYGLTAISLVPTGDHCGSVPYTRDDLQL